MIASDLLTLTEAGLYWLGRAISLLIRGVPFREPSSRMRTPITPARDRRGT